MKVAWNKPKYFDYRQTCGLDNDEINSKMKYYQNFTAETIGQVSL